MKSAGDSERKSSMDCSDNFRHADRSNKRLLKTKTTDKEDGHESKR